MSPSSRFVTLSEPSWWSWIWRIPAAIVASIVFLGCAALASAHDVIGRLVREVSATRA